MRTLLFGQVILINSKVSKEYLRFLLMFFYSRLLGRGTKMKKKPLFYSLLFFLTLVLFTFHLEAKEPEIVPTTAPQFLYEDTILNFEVKDIDSNHLKWDFGDGSIVIGSKKAEHIYKARGNYTIRVIDMEGKYKDPIISKVRILKDDREIVFQSNIFMVGIPIQMKAQGFSDLSIHWDFGDGTVQDLSRNVSHTYNRRGTFTVKAVDQGGKDVKEITTQITIDEDSRTLEAPKEIITGEPVDLSLKNSQGRNYTWEFSDGQRVQGPYAKNITFNRPGIIKITIKDKSGTYPPLNEQITVSPDKRRLTSSTSFALPGESIRFNAENFKGPKITWDFGDGPAVNGGKTMTHKYNESGTYTVIARDDNGKSKIEYNDTIRVNELSPDFRLNYLEIAFENGKAYKIAPLKNLPPGYIVKMKAQGRGILRGKWKLDNQTLGLFQVLLQQNKIVQLKDGQVAPLPMKDTGIHELTLEFTNYNFQQPIPTIRYFITEADAIKIVYPKPGSKLTVKPNKPPVLKWDCPDPLLKKKSDITYQVVVTDTPIRFMSDERTDWQDAGTSKEFTPDLTPFKGKGQLWIYWQVRTLKPNGRVLTISDIASFKLNQ